MRSIVNDTRSERRVMIVTGASSGIGRALAERAARAGWRVFAVGRRAERLEELKRAGSGATGAIATSATDVREAGAPARIVRDALGSFGRIDVVVNNAGTVASGPISLQSDEALREQLATHVIAPLALVREALGELRRNRGQIVFVGSGVARIPVSGLGAYPPAKAAVRSMARIARNELRPFGIAVTYTDPGAVATEFMTRAGFSGPPGWIGASPHEVARRILHAIERRKSVVNAIPWQTAVVALGELFPALTDLVLTHAPQVVGTKVAGPPKDVKPPGQTRQLPEFARKLEPLPEPPTLQPKQQPLSPFEAALEPIAYRMRRSNLSATFVSSLLLPGAELEVGDVALSWAGMPNKHERELTHQVLEALADAGFLARLDQDRYSVVRPYQ
jgi:short-subunit dehydrogenase